MSNAFKCDRCNDFSEGKPQRFKIREYLSKGMTGWSDSQTHMKWELCDKCKEDLILNLEAWVKELREVPDE